MPTAATRSGVRPSSRSPRNQIWPLVGLMFCMMQLNTVVLPAPFGPITLWISRSRISRSRLPTAVRPPKRMVSCFVERMDSPGTPASYSPGRCSACAAISATTAGGGSSTSSSPAKSWSSRRRVAEGHRPSGRIRIITISATP